MDVYIYQCMQGFGEPDRLIQRTLSLLSLENTSDECDIDPPLIVKSRTAAGARGITYGEWVREGASDAEQRRK